MSTPTGVALSRSGQFVIMDTPGFHLHFDTMQGGTPLSWYMKPSGAPAVLVTNPFPGSGASINWETGQDPTQATANGPDPYVIARLDQPNTQYEAYYASELIYSPPSASDVNAVYSVGGVAPYFWLSHEAIDDAIPTDPIHNNDYGWVTLYHNIANLPVSVFSDFGTPIFFMGTASLSSGIIFIGNEMTQTECPTLPWNQVLCPIPNGQVSARINISFEQSGADSIASLMLRRSVSEEAGADITTAYQSPGYFLTVNYSGALSILRSDGTGIPPVLVWGGTVVDLIQNTILTTDGAQLEVRTYLDDPAKLEIWVNQTLIGSYTDPTPILGDRFALFAQTTSGMIKFSKRQVFGMCKQFTATYTGLPTGEVQFDLSIQDPTGLTASEPFYRTNMPGVFLSDGISSPVVKAWDVEGAPIDLNTAFPNPDGQFCGIVPILRTPAYVGSMWLGSADGSQGVYSTPLSATINGVATTESHAGLSPWPLAVLALNALPQEANNVPVTVTSVTLSSLWKASVG